MSILDRIRARIYYPYANWVLIQRTVSLPEAFKNKRNIFLYFDYEREFGGHRTNIKDSDIFIILDLLDQFKLKSTWFVVGKILEQYPESVEEILQRGHEIGSHSYNHISPVNTQRVILQEDFENFYEITSHLQYINGFHSPTGGWSLRALNYLDRFGFTYDVIGCRKDDTPKIALIKLSNNREILRLSTVGDDWLLYNKYITESEAFHHFDLLQKRINIGHLGGIGFHPWVLISNRGIFKGFEKFLDNLNKQISLVNINSAGYYASKIELS